MHSIYRHSTLHAFQFYVCVSELVWPELSTIRNVGDQIVMSELRAEQAPLCGLAAEEM